MNALIYTGLPKHYQKRFKDNLIRKNTLSSIETIPEIIKAAAICFDLEQDEVIGICRQDKFVKVRAIIIKTIRSKFKNVTLKMIGAYLNKNHASIIHSLRKYDEWSKVDNDFQDMIIKFTKYRYAI